MGQEEEGRACRCLSCMLGFGAQLRANHHPRTRQVAESSTRSRPTRRASVSGAAVARFLSEAAIASWLSPSR